MSSHHVGGKRRRGATTVEFAFVAPIMFFTILATIIGSLGVSRYQQVASLAREASRWASVHGSEYQQETGQPAATAEDIFNQAVLPSAVGLSPDALSYEVTWDRSNIPLEVDEDVQNPFGNTVTVTVSYQWFPEVYLVGPINLTSSSTDQVRY
jgi:Flp pilus assembly protein TadG